MVADAAIENYALAGAIGAMFYVEPFSTKDIDVFVLTPGQEIVTEILGLDDLGMVAAGKHGAEEGGVLADRLQIGRRHEPVRRRARTRWIDLR